MRPSRRFASLSLVVLALLLGACQQKVPTQVRFDPKPSWEAAKPLDDLREMPQDAAAYLDKATADKPLMNGQTAKLRSEVYIERLFAPWRGPGNPAYARKSAMKSLAAYSRNPGYDGNGAPNTVQWAQRIAQNANLRYFAKWSRPAVAVRNSNLRAIPTMDPRFGTPGKPGQGYPFDMLQMSALWVGTPMNVVHLSRDGAWALVETAICPGWVPVEDLAYVDEEFMARYLSRPFATVIAENVPLGDAPRDARAGVGAVLPVEDSDGVRLKVMTPVPGPSGRAQTRSFWLTQGEAALMPMEPTPANIARVVNKMMGQTYGWGGLDGKRDCSAATRDALAPFGIWLPRNSASQAKSGAFVSVEGMSPREKEQAILGSGVPYATLIWLPGHIMLYLGQYKGHPVAFHNVWGMRTLEPDGSEGRRVIGKAVVTTLRVGEIYPEVGPERILLNRVRGITLLAGDGRDGLEPEAEAPDEQ